MSWPPGYGPPRSNMPAYPPAAPFPMPAHPWPHMPHGHPHMQAPPHLPRPLYPPVPHAPQQPPPPPPARPPIDDALAVRVRQFADFVVQNGDQAEAMARSRSGGDPAFGFLVGGPGAEFYKWYLHTTRWRWSPEQVAAAVDAADMRGKGFVDRPLPQAAGMEVGVKLGRLASDKASIRETVGWLLGYANCAGAVAEVLAARVRTVVSFEDRLNIAFVVGDMCTAAISSEMGSPPTGFLKALAPHVTGIVTACAVATRGADDTNALDALLTGWESRGLWPPDISASLRSIVSTAQSGPPPASHSLEAMPVGVMAHVLQYALSRGIPAYTVLDTSVVAAAPRPPPAGARTDARLAEFYKELGKIDDDERQERRRQRRDRSRSPPRRGHSHSPRRQRSRSPRRERDRDRDRPPASAYRPRSNSRVY